MRKVKLFFTMLMLVAFNVGNVWAVDQSFAFSTIGSTGWTNSYADHSITCTDGTVSMNASKQTSTISDCPVTKGQPVSFVLSDNTKSLSAVSFTCKQWGTKAQTITLKYSTDGGDSYSTLTPSVTSSNFSISSSSLPTGTNAVQITFSSQSNQVGIQSMSYTLAGNTPDPSVSADPEEVTNVAFAGVTNQTIDLTYENITGYETEVTVHPNADGTGTLSPAWLTASVTDADDYATVTYSVSANEGAARTAYIKVYTTDGDKEATTIIPVSQVKYSAPTGTFELFTGDIEEGDYVIYYGGGAMNTTVTSNRLQYLSVTPSENKIVDPDEAIVWHIAASGDYWTLYNAAVEKYAGGTTTKNQGAVLAEVTDYAKWTITGSSTYDFENLGRANGSSDTGNKWLRKNGTYGFACYSSTQSGTGPLTLYKKQVAGQPATPEFSVAEGNYEEAQSVEISCETVGATIHYTLDGTKPTSSSPTYSTALNISSTTTVKAIAIKDDVESTVATATYTIVVWQTVDEIWSSITSEGPTNANVWGYVSQANVGGYNNNYYISVDGSLTANQLEIYKGDNAGNTVAVGDKVHVNGDLTIFNEIKEFKQNTGVIVHYAAKGALQSVAVDGTPTKTEYASGEDFDPAGLKVLGTYANGFVGEITEGITWGNDLTDGKVTENTTVHVTATVNEVASLAYDVAVTVAAKTLVSIAVGTASYTIYTGEALPQPVVTATFSEGEPENVSAFAVYDTESVFDTEVIDNPDPQTITVSYTFGGATQTATYTVSVKDYANADDAPYTVTEALHIITAAIGNTESAREIVVAGTVSAEKVSNYKNRYKISDGVNELLVYNGKGFNEEAFTDNNYPKVGDVMVVKGNVINFNNNTPEFATGKSYLLSQIRPATIAIEDVASFEVGTADLAVTDLTVTTPSDGDITLVSGDEAKATIIANAIHAVAPGTVTITANLAATENDDALNYAAASTTFDVTVIAATIKYAITFDGNGNTGGSAPAAIADKAAGEEVTLPANSYTKTNKIFDGWKVINNTTSAEVEVTAGAFEMPASAVTIQAQWAEIPYWATQYGSNVTLSYTGTGESNSKVIINEVEYPAQKVGSGSNDGSVVVTVPSGTHTLHFHAVAWNGKSVTITASGVENMSVSSFPLIADAGFKASGTYTLENDPVDQYFAMTFDAVAEETQITFSKTDGDDRRFLLYGVNQEGGVLPASIAANPASISFGSVEQNASVAAKTINVTLTSVNSATVTLAGDNAFSIDKTSLTANGIIMVTPNTTATIGAHNATITISDDDEAADDVVVNVSMTVTEPVINDDVTGTWNLVTDAADLMAGMQVIMASVADGEGNLYTLGGPNGNSANNRLAVASTASGDVLNPEVGTKVITLVDAGNGKYALQLLNGKYLYAQGGTSNNYLKERSDINDQATWTITFEEGKAIIKADVSGRNWIRYNKDNNPKIFSCYASGQQDIVLYAKPFDYTREIAQGVLSTTCLPNGGQIFGASIFEIAYMDYDGTTPHKIYFDEVEGGIMEAGMPYVILANEGSSRLGVYYTDSENKTAQSKKGLVGYIGAGKYLEENDYFIYNNMFYYVSATDAANNRIHISNNRAFINLSQVPGYNNEPVSVPAPGRRRVSLGNGANAPQVATGFEAAEANEAPRKVLINGEFFIIRGEKMYDAKGQLVK